MERAASPFVLGITPFERPDACLAVALCRAGAMGAIDLGCDPPAGLVALADAGRELEGVPGAGPLGARLHRTALPAPKDLPGIVDFVILPAGVDVAPWRERRVLVRVASLEEAARAEASGADGLLAAGSESGGRAGEDSAFLLLQRLRPATGLPIWVQGGIGPQTAAACLAGGASGVALDSQLALAEESAAPPEIRRIVAAMDGTETVLVAGRRVHARPGGPRHGPTGQPGGPTVAELERAGSAAGLLPVGQDAAFARPLAERHRTVAGIVAAVREAALAGVRNARELEPLDAGSPLAAAHGTRYPVLQGPMTRVSDRAAFAAAVAGAGGLPFLALSLLEGDRLRELLDETARLLEGRPWGVGILGFVPPDLRRAQLAAILEARPPFALIAGGRPSQARALEARGIATYLHVPSGGLLELFLKEGARRFVFEGRECGGHIGPLSSFSLWQTQIGRLLEHERPEELAVVFAGGIGDGRAAAMVAAMAAPLASRGAKVGILMGTAYLFTNEVVETGAVVPGYQEAAIACRSTVLIETGPGHATRCVATPYAEDFLAARRRLEAEGVRGRELWTRLERLNLGRLRMASKGLARARDGRELVPIDEETQRRQGMYMIGQVAALRDGVTTIAELHREVCDGPRRVLEALELRDETQSEKPRPRSSPSSEPAPPPRPADVAIVGMAAHFPRATDLDRYWANVLDGVDAITEVPRERWDPAVFYDAAGKPGTTTPSKWGGFLDEIVFDPARYGIPPRSLAAIDPIQLLSLEIARRALEDAGYGTRPFDRERAAVIFGAEGGTDLSKAYGFRATWQELAGPLPRALDEHLPVPTEDSFPGVLTNVISGRIANRLDLGGENYTVNAACASSLAALATAVQWLTAGTCDMAIVGGADVHNSIGDFLMFSSVHALSPSGRCRTFDAAADGITLGEGVGAVVVKRLADAERDGDRIYAVIRGIGGSSDGKSLGLTAPRLEGQQRALRWAYRTAGISPAEIGLMEAHGTGTVVGDRTELQSMEGVFAEAGARPATCELSSVKSQIGHTKAAAGIASLIKTALCLHHGVLPPTLHVERPNPQWDPERSPFTLSDRARPWRAGRRAAAVSAFGFGGTNYHVVLTAQGVGPVSARAVWPAELFLIRGADRGAALERLDLLAAAGAAEPAWTLRDLARSASSGGEGPVQAAFVATGGDDLSAKIARAREALGGAPPSEGDPDVARIELRDEGANAQDAPGGVAFLFPGQGSQYAGMLADLFVAFPGLRGILDLAPEVAFRMHPPGAFTAEARRAREAALTETESAQVAIGMCDVAVLRVLERLGVAPDMLAGHSYGEMVALHAAGAWDLATLLDLSRARARAILAAAGGDPGAMAAVQAGAGELREAIADLDVVPANLNAPRQTILAGPTAAIERTIERLTTAGVKATRLNVACAFHSPVVAAARGPFAEALAAAGGRDLSLPVWSNTTAAPYPTAGGEVRELLADQLAKPVRFADQIEAMADAGARVFVEVGPGRVLTGLVGRVLGRRPHLAIPIDVRGEPGLVRLLLALARLAAAGVAFEPERLFDGRRAERFDLEDPPARALAATAWRVDGQWARPVAGEPPAGAFRPAAAFRSGAAPLVPSPIAGAVAGAGVPSLAAPTDPAGRELAVVEYLRNLREIVEGQRQVMLRYLGAAEPATAPAGGVPRAGPAPAASGGLEAPPEPAADGDGGGASEAKDRRPDERPLGQVLIAIVAERTGYPIDMLDLDLDLEADLSIDSIKRIEILGVLNEEIGLAGRLGDDRDELLEELASIKTLRGIEAWIVERAAPAGDSSDAAPEGVATAGARETEAAAESEAGAAHADGIGGESDRAGAPLSRFRFEVRPAAPAAPNGSRLARRSFLVTDDGRGVATLLLERIRGAGAEARLAARGATPGDADALVHLAPLSPGAGPEDVKSLFRLARPIVARGPGTILAATGMGGRFGHGANGRGRPGQGGIAGFLKSLAKEWPEGRVRAVDLDPEEAAATLADRIWREIATDDPAVEVGYAGGERVRLAMVEADPVAPAGAGGNGAGPPLLDAESIVLVTGGVRGIGARLSIELARRYRCRLELVGRSPEPPAEEAQETARVEDPRALRRLLARLHPGARPAEIESRWRTLRAEREIRSTMAALREAGSAAAYHVLDVRDEDGFGALLDALYARHGRLDAVVHAAGTIEDRLLVRKTAASFDRVFDTKVAGALTLARKLRGDARFVVFFSSVAGILGNRGQTDYAAANDFLDKLALHMDGRAAARVVSVNWGPWDEIGMVTPELRREYERRGVDLIPPDLGVRGLLDELAHGAAAQVVLTSGALGRG